MNLPNESKMTLRGVKYSLIKANPIYGEGFVFVVDEPNKASDNKFFTPDEIFALVALTKTKG
jgi:hypothetical protein